MVLGKLHDWYCAYRAVRAVQASGLIWRWLLPVGGV